MLKHISTPNYVIVFESHFCFLAIDCLKASVMFFLIQNCIAYMLLLLLIELLVGSPVLGYLAAGILIGPYGFSIIRNVHATKAIAEFGVVFLLFNIGLEVNPI